MSEKEIKVLGLDVSNTTVCKNESYILSCNEELSNEKPLRILFVSSENVCRSPMAQAYVNHVGQSIGIFAHSAGLFPKYGEPISENAVKALTDRGVTPCPSNPFNKHTSSSVTLEMIETSSVIVGMTESHTLALIRSFPQAAQRIISFPCDISDSAGLGHAGYANMLSEIIQGVHNLFSCLNDV